MRYICANTEGVQYLLREAEVDDKSTLVKVDLENFSYQVHMKT